MLSPGVDFIVGQLPPDIDVLQAGCTVQQQLDLLASLVHLAAAVGQLLAGHLAQIGVGVPFLQQLGGLLVFGFRVFVVLYGLDQGLQRMVFLHQVPVAGAVLEAGGILESMVVKNVKTGELTEIVADEDDGTFGVFCFIGFLPNSELFEGKVEMDHGYIVTDADMHTNIPGVFAAGDVRVKSLRQVVTAAADGAIAATQANKYIEGI